MNPVRVRTCSTSQLQLPLMLLLLLLLLNACIVSSSTTGVRLVVSLTETGAVLECAAYGTVEQAKQHSVQFKCPLAETYCFEDCRRVCTSLQGCPEWHLLRCGVKVSAGRKSVSISLPAFTAVHNGDWSCSFSGIESGVARLAFQNRSSLTTRQLATQAAVTKATAASTRTTKRIIRTTTAATTRVDWGKESGRDGLGFDGRSQTRDAKLDKVQPGSPTLPTCIEAESSVLSMSGGNSLWLLLFLLAISIVFNVAFIVRCLLVCCYVGIRKRSKTPGPCLARLLCVTVVESSRECDENDEERHRHQQQHYEELKPPRPPRQPAHIVSSASLPHPQPHAQLQRHASLQPSRSLSRPLYDDAAESPHGSRGSLQQQQLHRQYSLRSLGRNCHPVPEETPLTPLTADELEDSASQCSREMPHLQLSSLMLRKADTLLKEADSLLMQGATIRSDEWRA